MYAICSDLEGVFIPEIWINVAKATGVEDLKLTTRDIPDYDKLMRYRIEIMAKHNLTLADIQKVIASMDLLPGADEMLRWLLALPQPFFILSDTFVEFALPFLPKLNYASVLCNSLVIDDKGAITGYTLRQPDGKRKVVEALHAINYQVIAFGDSYNDLSMIQSADYGFLFRAPAKIKEDYPGIPLVDEYADLKKLIADVL